MTGKQALQDKKGFGLVEIIVGTAVISLSLIGLMAVAQIAIRLSNRSSQEIKAGYLLEEGVEAVKLLRDEGWAANIASLSPSSDYYLEFNSSFWRSTTTNTYINDIFERKFRLEDVYRDAGDNIAPSGALDLNTKKAVVYVSWTGKAGTTTKSASTYITNLFNN